MREHSVLDIETVSRHLLDGFKADRYGRFRSRIGARLRRRAVKILGEPRNDGFATKSPRSEEDRDVAHTHRTPLDSRRHPGDEHRKDDRVLHFAYAARRRFPK